MEMNVALDKIRKLIAVADHPNTNAEEAATFRARAEKLMREYRVEEENILAEDATAISPVKVQINVSDISSPYAAQYLNMMYYVAWHCGLEMASRSAYVDTEDGGRQFMRVAYVVGYESDIRYAEFLFTAAQLVFSEKVEPAYKPELSDAENIYRLRSSGMERNRVAQLVLHADTHSAHAKVGKVYKEECEKRGEKPQLNGRQINAKTFREAYAKAFTDEFYWVLSNARNAADSVGGAVTLHGRKERVKEAYYNFFPHLRPSTDVAKVGECEECKKTKHPSKMCKVHRPRKETQAQRDRRYREQHSASARAGQKVGVAAAREVDVNRVARAKRLEEDNVRTETRKATGLELSN